jgi:hypothetical protein
MLLDSTGLSLRSLRKVWPAVKIGMRPLKNKYENAY